MAVRYLGSVAGLIGSLRLAIGEVVRFNTRAMMMRVAEVTDTQGWGVKVMLGDRVIEELAFWRDNLSRLNGHLMRKEDRVLSQ